MSKGRGKAGISLCAIVVVLSSSTPALAYTGGTLVHLRMSDFFRLDSQQAWTLVHNRSDKTFLFWTSDGGNSWRTFSTPFSLQNIFFLDPNNGWATAIEQVGGRIRFLCLRTSDSGRTWNKLSYLGSSDKATGIAFDSNEHGWIVGEGDRREEKATGTAFVYETTDGGEHWSKLPWSTEPASGLYGVCLHHGTGFAWSAGGGGSGIFKLRPGALPERISNLETMNFAFVSGDSILSASQFGVYLKTPADRDWQQVLKPENETFWDMKFVDADHGCVAGGEIYCTSDGGQTWESRHVPRTPKGENEYIYKLYVLDALQGWAVGDDSIYQTNDGGHSWSKVDFFGVDDCPLIHPRRIG